MSSAIPLPDSSESVAFSTKKSTERYHLDHVSDDTLHTQLKSLTGRHHALTAELLAHLAEVDARGIYRERACSSLYTYCVYELRLSEDEAQRRSRAARVARTFPVLFQMLAEGAIHLTGLLLLAPYLTLENHTELLARARFRTKREIEHLIAEIAPKPDVPARIEPLGPRPAATGSSWQAFTASLRGAVRDLVPGFAPGQAPPPASDGPMVDASNEVAPVDAGGGTTVRPNLGAGEPGIGSAPLPPLTVDSPSTGTTNFRAPIRYHVEFTASQRYVELLEEARDLLQHQVPNRDIARVNELAMAEFVELLRKRRQAAIGPARRPAGSKPPSEGTSRPEAAPARVDTPARQRSAPARERSAPTPLDASEHDEPDTSPNRYIPAEVRRSVWQRDGKRCTFTDSNGRRCAERAGLEVHHEHAFALGGPTTTENLRLICRAHNRLLAERAFGRAHVRSIVERARNGRPSG